MKKEKWFNMSDDQKTSFMRNVFKDMDLGETFDYAECVRISERMKEHTGELYGVFNNPCIVLELVDPVMAHMLLGWMYRKFNDQGETDLNGDTAPLFGYNMVELYLDKGSLMDFSDSEKDILREAVRIIKEKTNKKDENTR